MSASTAQAPLHVAGFYHSDDFLAQRVASFIREGLAAGEQVVVLATVPHWTAISTRLNQSGLACPLAAHYFDLPRLEAAKDLIMVDAAETLSRFMHAGMPDPTRFRDCLVPVIEQASRGRDDCVIRAYGEMVDILWQEGRTAAAIRLEMLWNQLARTHSFALLCGYSMGHFYKDVAQQDVRRQHTHLVGNSGERLALH